MNLDKPSSTSTTRCIVVFDQQSHAESARDIASRLHLPCEMDSAEWDSCFRLQLGDQGWRLVSPKNSGMGILKLDFGRGRLGWRLRQTKRGHPLGRAFGLSSARDSLEIVDATAGLGRDALMLAALKNRVVLVERHPVIAFLLKDAIERTAPEEIRERVTIENAESGEYLRTPPFAADGIYLDPMYPDRTKSALVKQEMRILRALVGADYDSEKLLQSALHSGARRVVVKRPANAPPLGDIPPSHFIKEPNTRYDVYVNKLS